LYRIDSKIQQIKLVEIMYYKYALNWKKTSTPSGFVI
jgi:hypothetical protein